MKRSGRPWWQNPALNPGDGWRGGLLADSDRNATLHHPFKGSTSCFNTGNWREEQSYKSAGVCGEGWSGGVLLKHFQHLQSKNKPPSPIPFGVCVGLSTLMVSPTFSFISVGSRFTKEAHKRDSTGNGHRPTNTAHTHFTNTHSRRPLHLYVISFFSESTFLPCSSVPVMSLQ